MKFLQQVVLIRRREKFLSQFGDWSIAITSCYFLFGCASYRQWPVQLESNPSGATAVVMNRKGEEIQRLITPATVSLRSGYTTGLFLNEKPEGYHIRFEKTGYSSISKFITADVNYLGGGGYNLLFGGSMYKLDSRVSVTLPVSKRDNSIIQPKNLSDFKHDDFEIVEYQYDSKTRKGIVIVNIGNKGFGARLWVVENIGIICSSKNTTLISGKEILIGARYVVLDESIKDNLLRITFEVVY